MRTIASDASRPAHTLRVRRGRPSRPQLALAGGVASGVALALLPVRTLAATAAACADPAVLPESPAGPALLLIAAAGVLGVVAHRRRRRGGLTGTIVSTLTVVVLAGALLSTVLAGAATTSSCGDDPPSPGGVLAAQSSTPFTGADIPWITAGVLVVSGIGVTALARRRRRSAD